VEEEPGYRVDVCASCKSYIKTIDFREMDRTALPQFDDLDSLALDFVAREQGYIRPTLSAWGF
jgi:FdhE protein